LALFDHPLFRRVIEAVHLRREEG